MALNLPPTLYDEFKRRVSRVTDRFFLNGASSHLVKLDLSDTVDSALLEWAAKSLKSGCEDPKTQQTARMLQSIVTLLIQYPGQPVAKITRYEGLARGTESWKAVELRLIKASGGLKFLRRKNNLYLVSEGEAIFYLNKSPATLADENLELPERGKVFETKFPSDFFPLIGDQLRGYFMSNPECRANKQRNLLFMQGENLPGFSSIKEIILAGEKAVGRYFSARK